METSDQRKQIEQHLIEKALKDETFRKQLMENPNETIELEIGMKLPMTIKIRILEEDARTAYLILPQTTLNSNEEELTEADLATVSGGYGEVSLSTICISCTAGCCKN
ncbi:MAG: NHLP leader peptide family RiPP precursor [Bacteroidota bacterium]